MHPQHHLRAIGYALTGYTLWVLSDTLMKLAGEASLPPYEIIGFLGLFMALLAFIGAGATKQITHLWPKSPKAQLGRALLSVVSNLANALALNHLPLTLFYVTVFTAPMIVALLAAFCLRENLTLPKVIAIIVGFMGVVIAINPFGQSGGDWIGYVAATTSTVCFAGSNVWLRRMTQSESILSIAFFTSCVEVIVGFGLVLLLRFEPVALNVLLILIAMSFFCVSGNMLGCLALRLTSAATVAQFHYTQLVAGAFIGYVIWHDIPSGMTMIGAAIIIGSGLYIAATANRASGEMRESPGISFCPQAVQKLQQLR